MSVVFTVLITILLFGAIIFIHELGHFTCAKLSGVTVKEFALGMGPTIFSRVSRGTKYALRLLPIGGYVSMEGEDEDSDDENAFFKKPVYKRILIVLAGAVMNMILGFVILTIVVSIQPKLGSMQIADFRQGATSCAAGKLQKGDTIKKIDGLSIYDVTDLQYQLSQKPDNIHTVTVKRNGETITISDVNISFVTYTAEDGKTYRSVDFVRQQVNKTPLTVIGQAAGKTASFARLVWISLGDLVRGKASVKDMSGPVGVATAVNKAQSAGIDSLLVLAALITINVGIFNLLPLPALDGGRFVFLAIEGVIRRPVPQKYEAMVHAVGFILLMILMLLVTFNDVFRLIK